MMQIIYFLLFLFIFTACFGHIWPSSGVPLPELFHCMVFPLMSHINHIYMS
jgi:hypothetical protein